uniref:Transmembrane protein n=1 Tax=Strongyloides venezuelensis TaxID=75913 RepID=A0A0K0EW36_STRVS
MDKIRKAICMTERFFKQDDSEEKTLSPLRQSSDSKTIGYLFVEKVVGTSVSIPSISLIVQEGSWIITQNIKFKNFEENEKKKPLRSSKDSGDDVLKNLLNVEGRKGKDNDEMSKPCAKPSNAQVHGIEEEIPSVNVNGSEGSLKDNPAVGNRRKIVRLKEEIDVWHFGVAGKKGTTRKSSFCIYIVYIFFLIVVYIVFILLIICNPSNHIW